MSRRLTISLPEPVLDALYAEGSRTCETVASVAVRVLREALPGHVERALRRDLAPVVRGRVIDVTTHPNAAGPQPKLGSANDLAPTISLPTRVADDPALRPGSTGGFAG